jgi:hypothetical protein
MEMLVSVASALTMVAWLVHPLLTHIRLIPLRWLKPIMMMEKMKAKKKTTTSKASRRPPHLFLGA